MTFDSFLQIFDFSIGLAKDRFTHNLVTELNLGGRFEQEKFCFTLSNNSCEINSGHCLVYF